MRGIGAEDLKRLGATGGVEPLPAAICMAPTLKMHAFGVLAHEKIFLERLVTGTDGFTFDMRLPACGKLGFVGIYAAIGATKDQHGQALSKRKKAAAVKRLPVFA